MSELIEDYGFLIKYLEKCREKNIDCTPLVTTSRILNELLKKISIYPTSFNEILKLIEREIGDLVNCEICIEVFRELYNINVTCEEAKKILLIQVTSWYIEILVKLGYVKLKPTWKP